MSQIYSKKHSKVTHRRGIAERVKELVDDWDTFISHAVQFTFTNDRADVVFRDGDIPNMDSACNPKQNNSLYSLEFYYNMAEIPPKTKALKHIIPIPKEQSKGDGGFLAIPHYYLNKRVNYKELSDIAPDEAWDGYGDSPKKDEDGKIVKDEKGNIVMEKNDEAQIWGDYLPLAIAWAESYDRYKYLTKKYEETKINILLYGLSIANKIIALGKMKHAYMNMLYNYGRIHDADLYAHFSPVSLISDTIALSDWAGKGWAAAGSTIWERIQKIGENKWYSDIIKENLDAFRDFQQKFSEFGFIPMKEKEKVTQEFRDTLNDLFDKLDAEDFSKEIYRFKNKMEVLSKNQSGNRIEKERYKISNRITQLESNLGVWDNNIGFFDAKSDSAEKLIGGFHSKIEKGKEDLKLLKEKLKIIDRLI